MAQKFASTKNFAAVLGLSAAKREHPYCKSEEFEYDSDAYWKCYMRYNTLPMFNSVGTCQMSGVVGKGVVDTQFRSVVVTYFLIEIEKKSLISSKVGEVTVN